MEFAKRELLKYGWTEGKGLGRDESGISEALKPKLKFDTRGLGHDNSEQFTYHWWEHLYNKAASNIDIKNGNTVVSKGKLDISTKKFTSIHLEETYGSFVKVSETVCEKPNEKGLFGALLTDEELFKACRGRTAHKGARHGMKLNGKLARIEKQEALFASQKQSKKDYESEVGHNETEKNCLDANLICNNDESIEVEHQEEVEEFSKMGRKNKRPKVTEINGEHSFRVKCPKQSPSTTMEVESKHKTRKKKSKRNKYKCLVLMPTESCEQKKCATNEVLYNRNELCEGDNNCIEMIQGSDFNSSTNCVHPSGLLDLPKKNKKKSKKDQYSSVTQAYEETRQTTNKTDFSTTTNIESNFEPHSCKKKKKKLRIELD